MSSTITTTCPPAIPPRVKARMDEIDIRMTLIIVIVMTLANADLPLGSLHVNFWAVYDRWSKGQDVGDSGPYVKMYDDMRHESSQLDRITV